MMDWKKLLTPKRLGKSNLEDQGFARTAFQRDYDRLIFSSAFRRLKDKTQVFSLPSNDYIRTRLIHSLEVASVGRSLGRVVGEKIIETYQLNKGNGIEIEAADFGDIVSAACLAHDIGNPPFGHAGEDAIQSGFQSWYNSASHDEKPRVTNQQKADFDCFEGNAQGFRILTRLEMLPKKGGMQLTCPTLAAFTKYPRESVFEEPALNGYAGKSIKKHGFFQSESELFSEVAETVGLIRRSHSALWWSRHPLAFLVEAADDICYSIVDVEDGYRMGYIPFKVAEELLNSIASREEKPTEGKEAEHIKYLRAFAIHKLIQEVTEIFVENEANILSGEFDKDLLSLSDKYSTTLDLIARETRSRVFENPDVIGIQIAGYKVLGGLFSEFADALSNNSKKSELICKMLPEEYRPTQDESDYEKILKITDYISGMTDSYATNLFQKFSGISL
ncbi:MAG: deoxyguanosinetriphosphate triphosphohydrolase [Elainellaceae cyanobacterium]